MLIFGPWYADFLVPFVLALEVDVPDDPFNEVKGRLEVDAACLMVVLPDELLGLGDFFVLLCLA